MSIITQFTRYAGVGILSNAVSYGAYLILTSMAYSPMLVASILYPLVMAVSFVANKTLTFNFKGRSLFSLMRFVIAHLLGYLLNLLLLAAQITHLEVPHQLAQLIAIFLVALFLFFMSRYFVFADSNRSSI